MMVVLFINVLLFPGVNTEFNSCSSHPELLYTKARCCVLYSCKVSPRPPGRKFQPPDPPINQWRGKKRYRKLFHIFELWSEALILLMVLRKSILKIRLSARQSQWVSGNEQWQTGEQCLYSCVSVLFSIFKTEDPLVSAVYS